MPSSSSEGFPGTPGTTELSWRSPRGGGSQDPHPQGPPGLQALRWEGLHCSHSGPVAHSLVQARTFVFQGHTYAASRLLLLRQVEPRSSSRKKRNGPNEWRTS